MADKIITVVFGVEELLEEIETLIEECNISVGLAQMMMEGGLSSNDPWAKYAHGKWAIFLAEEGHLYARPYSLFCEEYLKGGAK